MIHDFEIESNDPKNLTPEGAKIWWEKKQREDYFGQKVMGEAHFHFSKPELIAKMGLTKESRILEIGCGYGRETLKFCEISDNVFGIDISQTAADLTKKHCPEATTMSFDGTRIPFPDGTIDFAYNCFVIQHMSKENAKALIKDTMRVLKPGGKFLYEFFGGNYCAGEGRETYSGGLEGMYNNGYTQDEIRKLLTELGVFIEYIKENQVIADGTTNLWVCGRND
ncbi:MAG: class I SAM-dependent methyltransferase [bacterium]|nr:class I SAM-dependent methyltransferase [bacterium]